MRSKLRLWLGSLRQRLWVQPLVYCVIAIGLVALARLANAVERPAYLSPIDSDVLRTLLQIIATSMLAVATFAVGSVVSAYASASNQGTPRAFQLLVADDSSQNALSSFIGAFIFSVVALTALLLDLFWDGGFVALFALTLAIFGWVVLTFVGWTDNIARLGRVTTLILRAEEAAEDTLCERARFPALGGHPAEGRAALVGLRVTTDTVGYIQSIDMDALQDIAEAHDFDVEVCCPPGELSRPTSPLAVLSATELPTEVLDDIRDAFDIDRERNVASDPRFGVVILSEIAVRALSPGVNDPGTAIAVLARLTNLFRIWHKTEPDGDVIYDRVSVPSLATHDLFNDAFRAIGRDGSTQVEVMIHLMKSLSSLAEMAPEDFGGPAKDVAAQVRARCEDTLALESERAAVVSAGRGLF